MWNHNYKLINIIKTKDRKLKLCWHSAITADELVQNIFINTLVVVNSRELWSHPSIGQASVAYKSIGKHLERSTVITVSSDAVHPTLLYIDSIKGSKEAGFSTIVGAPKCSSAREIYTITDPLQSVAMNWH